MARTRGKLAHREIQRLETRERVFDAAIAEFKRDGAADADIGSISTAAGIARGTFYFHFPTKDHVLVELMRREELNIAEELTGELESATDVRTGLQLLVDRLTADEHRLGSILFRDLITIYLTSPELQVTDAAAHPVAVLVVDLITAALDRKEVHSDVTPMNSAKFFLLGLYALFITNRKASPARRRLIDEYITSFCRGLTPLP